MSQVNANGNLNVELASCIAGEDIANDWLKIKPAAPPVGKTYTLADLFASTSIAATSFNYGVVLDCAGYSQMFGRVVVNTTNGSAWWFDFGIGITSNVSSRYIIDSDHAVADNTVHSFDNVDANGMRAIGNWLQVYVYNPDSGPATITFAEIYLLP